MDLSAHAIYEKQFHDAWRGYNQKEVDDFLDRVAESLEAIQRENNALKNRIRELDQAVSTSRDTEEMLKKTLVTAQKASEEAIASAKAKAEQLIAEAEQRVTRANDEAKTRMAALEEEVRKKTIDADREHANRKRELDASIDRLRSYESELKQRLKTFLEQQLRALDSLIDEKPRPATRPEGAGQAAAGQATARPQAVPARTGEHPTQAQPAARPAGAPATTEAPGPSERAVDAEEAAGASGGRKGLRGLFWGDES